jgi:hypothetical protein
MNPPLLRSAARRLALPAALAVLLGVTALAPRVPAQEDTTRNLWDTGFLQERPKKAAPKRQKRPPRYRRAPGTTAPAQPSQTGVIVGVTVWRLRPSIAADAPPARFLVHEESDDAGATSWTPERVDVGTPLEEGQRVRLSVEAPRSGYLYVLDREQYADGSLSKPYLIFPTTRTRGGNNAVTAGAVVEIPAQSDNPIYFTLKRSRPDHAAEVVTIIVAPEPLDDVTIGDKPAALSTEQVAKWEAQWAAAVERVEMEGGAGTTYTEEEKQAGSDPNRPLTQDDPLPQTIYRVQAKPGDPILVSVPLPIRAKG